MMFLKESIMKSAFLILVLEIMGSSASPNDLTSKNVLRPLAFHNAGQQSRRNLIDTAAQTITAGVLTTSLSIPSPAVAKALDKTNDLYSVYQIFPDASANLSPYIKPIQAAKFLQYNIFNGQNQGQEKQNNNGLKGGVIWLGEHHNAKRDHDLQAIFIENIYNQRKAMSRLGKDTPKLSIGLEQIQVQYQQVLDDYVQGKITEEEMLSGCEWKTRWSWPFENYRSVFVLAKKLKIPLIALNVNSEDLVKVEDDGFKGLDRKIIRKYIKDPLGFAEFVKPLSYRTYSAYVIEPSYNMHKEMGILKTKTVAGELLDDKTSFRNFFSGRILWDEAMAGNAYEWTKDNECGVMIGLIGADHVKFEKGVVGRYQRLLNQNKGDSATKSIADAMNVSVLLNPTLIDTRPSGSTAAYMNASSSAFPDQITLQLRYLKDGVVPSSPDQSLPSSTGGVLPLADYIVISNA
jgi:hypothetical protein